MRKLSPRMWEALQAIVQGGGKVFSRGGGYWSLQPKGAAISLSSETFDTTLGTQTIYALEQRGLLERTHKDDRHWRDARRVTEQGKSLVGTMRPQSVGRVS